MAKLQSGTIVYGNLTVNTFANINGNLILGAQLYAGGSYGTNGQILQNVGGTGVAWANPSSGTQVFSGTSNVAVLSSGGNVVITVGGAIIANVGSTGLTVIGGISAGTFTGNGAGLTGINTGGLSYAITSGGSNVTVTASNVNVSVNGSNVASFGTYGLTVLSTSGSTSTSTGALQVAGGVGIGGNLNVGGGLAFSSTGQFITGDFTNSVVTNRVAFQTNTNNNSTLVTAIPNGSGSISGFEAYGNSNPTNTAVARFIVNATETRILSTIVGTGAYLPMTFYLGGSERLRVDTGGNLLVGTVSPNTYSNLTVGYSTPSINTTTGAIVTPGGVGIGGNLFAGQINTTGNILATNAILNALTVNGGIISTGTINTSGNVEAAVGTFNGLVLNGTITGVSSITASGLINTTANVSTAQLNAGQINTTGNILSTGGVFNALTVNGTITATGYINTTANISAAVANFGNVSIAGGSHININSIAPAGNAAVTLGNLTNQWSTIYGKATTAQYADLAEIYTSDKKYVPGTVLIFGGNEEVTISTLSHDPRIAGVVSTNPAYLMNSTETGVQVALTGRVPCRVLGPVRKGDRLVASEHAGIAQRLNGLLYEPGCIIGKALEEIVEPRVHTIEVVVGRL